MVSKSSKSPTPKRPKSREFCVVYPDGQIADANLHEPILAGNHPLADETGKEQARRAGLSEQEIEKLYD